MLNATASRAAKDRGQQMSIMFDGEWTAAVLVELEAWIATRRAQGHTEMTFEQFRHDAVSQPHSFKAWGSLPRLACAAGLIEPMVHGDGSPVMRAAESVKTHGHFVRVWTFSARQQPAATCPPNLHPASPSEGKRQPFGSDDVSARRHGGDAAGLLAAVAEFHRGRVAG
jgi:hypothetical protein